MGKTYTSNYKFYYHYNLNIEFKCSKCRKCRKRLDFNDLPDFLSVGQVSRKCRKTTQPAEHGLGREIYARSSLVAYRLCRQTL